LRAVEALQEVYALFRLELRRNVRSARVVALFALYTAFSVLALLIIGSIAKAMRAAAAQRIKDMGGDASAVSDAFSGARTGIVGWLFSGDTAIAQAFEHVPLMVFVVFKVTLIFLPMYVALMGFDQISGEIAQRSIRYTAVRARRSSLLAGKYLAQAALLLGLVLLIDAGIFLYAKTTQGDFSASALLSSLPRFWIAAAIFSTAYLALTSLCSALFRTPAVSLIFNLIALFVLWLVDWIGQSYPSVSLLGYASPSHYANGLLHPQLQTFAINVGGCAAITAAFLALSYLILRVRDI
jgi:ABC-2 type transport system permease protein